MGSPNMLEFVTFFPVVAARSGSPSDSQFDAPSLAVANLVVYGLLLLATLIQVPISARAIARANVRLPAAGTTIVLSITTIGYALGTATLFAKYNHEGYTMFFNLRIASTVLFDLKDAAIFIVVALVLRNRYRCTQQPSRGLVYFTYLAYLLLAMTMILLVVDMGVYAEASVEQLHSETFDAWSRFRLSNNIFCTFIAFQTLGILFLSASSFLVWTRTKKDATTSLIFFAIIPTILLHGITRIIFAIISVRPPLSSLYTSEARTAIDFASTIVYGALELAVITLLVILLARPHMWRVPPQFGRASPSPQFVCPTYVTIEPPPQVVYPQVFIHDVSHTKLDDQVDLQSVQRPYSFYHPYAYAQ